MKRSEKNNAFCKFWLKFPNFVAKKIMKCRGEVDKRGNTSIRINETNNQDKPIRDISEELYFEPTSLCWMDGTLGAWGLPSRLAFL